jgi:hypothetical protein
MNFGAYKRTLFSQQAFKKLVSAFLQAFGTIALVLGVLSIFFPNTLDYKYVGILIVSAVSLIWACIAIWPRKVITRHLQVPDLKIIIKVGDLFKEEDANLVIGVTDVFDTEKGDVIKLNSIQGQFQTKIYNDDRVRLDNDLDFALRGVTGMPDAQKVRGKNIRYPIGTVVTLAVGTKKYFCSAYSRMGIDLKAQSNIKLLSVSLEMLWDEIRARGQNERVAMAVLGSDLARIGNASHSNLIRLIVLLFILASREQFVTKELIILIHESNLDKVNLMELDEFLQNI